QDVWQDLLHRCNAVQAGRIVERRQFSEISDYPLNFWRDPHAGGVVLAAMDDAMSNGSGAFKSVQSCRGASSEAVEDASDGISGFFQLTLLPAFMMARAVRNQPRRVCRPVDAALGQQLLAFSLEEAKFKAARAGVTNQNFHFSLRHDRPILC